MLCPAVFWKTSDIRGGGLLNPTLHNLGFLVRFQLEKQDSGEMISPASKFHLFTPI